MGDALDRLEVAASIVDPTSRRHFVAEACRHQSELMSRASAQRWRTFTRCGKVVRVRAVPWCVVGGRAVTARYRGIVSQWAAVVGVCEQLPRYAICGTDDFHLQVPNSCKIYCEIEQAYTRVLYNM